MSAASRTGCSTCSAISARRAAISKSSACRPTRSPKEVCASNSSMSKIRRGSPTKKPSSDWCRGSKSRTEANLPTSPLYGASEASLPYSSWPGFDPAIQPQRHATTERKGLDGRSRTAMTNRVMDYAARPPQHEGIGTSICDCGNRRTTRRLAGLRQQQSERYGGQDQIHHEQIVIGISDDSRLLRDFAIEC